MTFSTKDYVNKIADFFNPEKAGDRSMTIVYKFHDSGVNDGTYTVTIKNGTCKITEGEAEKYDLKMLTTAEIYERIVFGKMPYDVIYWTGAILYFGSNLLFQEMQTFLDIPKETGIKIL